MGPGDELGHDVLEAGRGMLVLNHRFDDVLCKQLLAGVLQNNALFN